MVHPEEQESQIFDPLCDYRQFIQASPPPSSPRGGLHGEQDDGLVRDHLVSDNTQPDLVAQSETQHDSLVSRIEETQFEELYPETQNGDESQASHQHPAKLPEPTTAGIASSFSVGAMSLPPALPFERPKLDETANIEGFKFGKARKSMNFAMKAPNTPELAALADSSRSTSSPPKGLNDPPVAICSFSVDYESITPLKFSTKSGGNNGGSKLIRPGTVDLAPASLSELTTYGRLEAPQRKTLTAQHQAGGGSRESQPSIPRETPAIQSQQLPASGSPGTGHLVPENAGTTNKPARQPVETPRTSTSLISRPLVTPATNLQDHSNLPFPQKSGVRTANKSNKRLTWKPDYTPFPEIEPKTRREKQSNRSEEMCLWHAAPPHPLQPASTNTKIRNGSSESSLLSKQGVNRYGMDARESVDNNLDRRSAHSHAPPTSTMKVQPTTEYDACAQMDVDDFRNLSHTADELINETRAELPLMKEEREQSIDHHVSEEFRASKSVTIASNGHDDGVYPAFKPPSRVPPRSQSQSVESNTTKAMRRPFSATVFVPEGVPEHIVLRSQHPMRVEKSNSNSAHPCHGYAQAASLSPMSAPPPSSGQDLVRAMRFMENALRDCESQKLILESQQAELNAQGAKMAEQRGKLESQQSKLEFQQSKLASSQAKVQELKKAIKESDKLIQMREQEKDELTKKVKRFGDISARYKAHMNDVVIAQKHLMAENNRMKDVSSQLRTEQNAVLKAVANRDSHEKRLRDLIERAKTTIRPMMDKSIALEEENTTVKTEIEHLKQINGLLRGDIDARMVDLGRERHNTEQLQKNLEGQKESHKELIDALGKAQTTIIDELTKEGSVLSKLLTSENSVHAKIEELSAFVNAIKSQAPDLPPGLIKLLEDHYTKIDEKIQATGNADVNLNEASLKTFRDLKERINLLRLDDDTKIRMNQRIADLRESNAQLNAGQSAKELECQGLAKRIEELGQEVSRCHDQVAAKNNELVALRELQNEDPILQGKVQELEEIKFNLQSQLDTANREVTKVKEESATHRDNVLRIQDQHRELQSKLTEAQASMKSLGEEKKKLLATSKAEVDKACHEVAKSCRATQAEAQLKNDCQAKNLEQRRSEAERALVLALERIQEYEEERRTSSQSLTRLQEEMSSCQKRLSEREVYIQNVDLRIPSRADFDRRERECQKTLEELTQVRTHIDGVQNGISKKIEAFISTQQEYPKLIQKIDVIETASLELKKQNNEQGKAFEDFKGNTARFLRSIGALAREQSVEDVVRAGPVEISTKMGPPTAPKRTFIANRATRPTSIPNTAPCYSGPSDDRPYSDDVQDTPREALRRNEQKQESLSCSSTKSTETQGTIQTIPTKVAQKSAHFQGSSTNHVTLRPLRPANRKSSLLYTAIQIGSSSSFSSQIDTTSALGEASSQISVVAETPKQLTRSSAELARTSADYSQRSSKQPPKPVCNAIPSRSDCSSTIAQTPTTTLVSTATPLASSSSLSELDSDLVDQLEFKDEDEHVTNPKGKGTREVFTPMSTSTAATVQFRPTPTRHPLSDEDTSPSSKSIAVERESLRRRTSSSVPLKSALKGGNKGLPTNDLNGGTAQLMSTPDVLTTYMPHSRRTTTDESQTRGRSGSSSSYNRVATGTAKGLFGCQNTVEPISVMNSLPSSDKSPLMRASGRGRMARKRSASMTEDQSKPTKAPKQVRLSLPNQPHRSNRTFVPDSQDGVSGHC